MKNKILQIIIIIFIDCCIVAFSAAMPLFLRFGIFTVDLTYFQRMILFLPIDIAIAISVLAIFKLYTRIWSFAGMNELFATLKATLVIEAIFFAYKFLFQVPMPRSYFIFQWIFLFLLIGFSRLTVRIYKQIIKRNNGMVVPKNVLIVGAGSAASILIDELKYQTDGRKIVCMVDDNDQKKGKYIAGVLVAGNRFDIPKLVEKYRVDIIIIAMPSAPQNSIREIITICNTTSAVVKILPPYANNLDSHLEKKVRNINYEDLLCRNKVQINDKGLRAFLSDKVVLVTGAGGSIGSELCRQIISYKPKKLLILDIYENNLHELSIELNKEHGNIEILSIIASVRDADRMEDVFDTHRPQIIFHAAAHKHVPLMEASPCEAIKNNCGGTLNLSKLASKYRVENFILISTDKAVRPTSVMGASKRICEMIVQTYNKISDTKFVAVRFGNVLGSNGSVVPLFLKQIEEGGPITLTHKEVTRFFMTINEAVSLVLQAGIQEGDGELFILDMGEPVKIYDLAVNLIKQEGYRPDEDIQIEITGLRPGEKLYEELLMDEEGLKSTMNDLIFVGKSLEIDEKSFFESLDKLLVSANSNSETIREEIAMVCDNYSV